MVELEIDRYKNKVKNYEQTFHDYNPSKTHTKK